eukprot:2832925-Rhodomonas_salina.1
MGERSAGGRQERAGGHVQRAGRLDPRARGHRHQVWKGGKRHGVGEEEREGQDQEFAQFVVGNSESDLRISGGGTGTAEAQMSL